MSNVFYLLVIGAIGLGLILALTKYWYSKLYVKYSLEPTNLPYSIYLSAQLFSFALLYASILEPLVILRTIISADTTKNLWTETMKYCGAFIFLILILYVLLAFVSNLSIKIFAKRDTGLFEEIRSNNLAVSIIASVILISLSLIFYNLADNILNEFIPYPNLPRIF